MKRLVDFLKRKPWSWYFVLVLLAGAGPFVADVAILIDVISIIGTDIFLLSVLLYYRESLFGWVRPAISRVRLHVDGCGLLWPDRSWFRSAQDFGLCITYNLDVMVFPRRIVTCSVLLIAVVVYVQGLFP
jgi:hypothetical protein